MDVENVNRLHKEMKRREAVWMKSSKITKGKVVNDNNTQVLYREYMDAYRDWQHAAEQLDRETETAPA